jgi:hypothetical protein
MSRNLLLPLLLVTSLALAAEVPKTEGVAPADEAQVTAEEGSTSKSDTSAEVSELEPAADAAGQEAQAQGGAKVISGMSILGNQETPKALVIVPWKSSEIGESVGISTMLDDSRQPVDREVFLRALAYYEIRSETRR